MKIFFVCLLYKTVHPDFHWPNSFATDFRKLHWQKVSVTRQNNREFHLHATYTDGTWRGYTKGVSMVVNIAASN